MPVTLEDLIVATRRLADSNFATAAALNKLIPQWEQLRRDVYDVKTDRENDVRMYHQTHNEALADIGTSLATIAERMQRMPGDVTGAFKLAQAEEVEKTAVERIFARLERARTSTKIWILVFLVVAIVSGWGRHLFE